MTAFSKTGVRDRFHTRLFQTCHSRFLIYNTCWEDPRIDRKLLGIGSRSRIAMITSAGCNALDYLLDSPCEIHSVDLNHRQNALLDLKIALFRKGNFDDLDAMFGRGTHERYRAVYRGVCPYLRDDSKRYWNTRIRFFSPGRIRKSFYFHGLSGSLAWFFRSVWFRLNRQIPDLLDRLLSAQTLTEQQHIFEQIESQLFTERFRKMVNHPFFLSAIGVPVEQARLITTSRADGMVGYIHDCLKHVFTQLDIGDNYFWRVYITGSYSEECRPNYLKKSNFEFLKNNVHRIQLYNSSLSDMLISSPRKFSHFILLDHQDWMAHALPAALTEEWRLILAHSEPNARILIRSASPELNFLTDDIRDRLQFYPKVTQPLHQSDRVGTYASLHLAEVR